MGVPVGVQADSAVDIDACMPFVDSFVTQTDTESLRRRLEQPLHKLNKPWSGGTEVSRYTSNRYAGLRVGVTRIPCCRESTNPDLRYISET